MISAFAALALDVPVRLLRGKVLWILVVVTMLLAAGTTLPVGIEADARHPGGTVLTVFGPEMSSTAPPNVPGLPHDPAELVLRFVEFVQGKLLAGYLGVFVGLLVLADAVPTAFASGAAELNLTKPVGRGTVLLARHLGAVLVASGFALLLVGSTIGIVWIRTHELPLRALLMVPVSIVLFALLHAIGAVGGLLFRNALLGAVASLLAWGASVVTSLAGALEIGSPVMMNVAENSRRLHRILPRASDLGDLGERITMGSFASGGMAGEVELIVQVLLWTGFALGAAILVVRRRDF